MRPIFVYPAGLSCICLCFARGKFSSGSWIVSINSLPTESHRCLFPWNIYEGTQQHADAKPNAWARQHVEEGHTNLLASSWPTWDNLCIGISQSIKYHVAWVLNSQWTLSNFYERDMRGRMFNRTYRRETWQSAKPESLWNDTWCHLSADAFAAMSSNISECCWDAGAVCNLWHTCIKTPIINLSFTYLSF